jgi:hypothetical protein
MSVALAIEVIFIEANPAMKENANKTPGTAVLFINSLVTPPPMRIAMKFINGIPSNMR